MRTTSRFQPVPGLCSTSELQHPGEAPWRRIQETETLTAAEHLSLAPHFTDLQGPVFALTNLPEVVKGALFARYSRSPKSLRRLFADEFVSDVASGDRTDTSHATRAEALYEKVFVEYGDDSVAQLGGVHLAVEGASNVLTNSISRRC